MVEGGSVQPLQATACRVVLALVIAVIAFAVTSGCGGHTSAAHPACADAVLEDWTRGTLAPTYPADCYQAAIDALPEDLRSYTSAADDIARVADTASREGPVRTLAAASGSPEAQSVRALPLTVVVLAALVSVLAASGLAAALLRRRRAR